METASQALIAASMGLLWWEIGVRKQSWGLGSVSVIWLEVVLTTKLNASSDFHFYYEISF